MNTLSFIFLVFTANVVFAQYSTASIEAEYIKLQEEAAWAHSYKISLVSLSSFRLTAGTVETIQSKPDFVVSCSNGSSLALLKDWFALTKSTEPLKGGKPDVRVVFTNKDDIIGFSASGEDGYLNGMPVHFSESMQRWYAKHILPLAKALFVHPPRKK